MNSINCKKKEVFHTSVDSMKKRVILATKKALISICQEKAIEYLQVIAGEEICSNLHEIFAQLGNLESRLLESALAVISFTANDSMQRIYED